MSVNKNSTVAEKLDAVAGALDALGERYPGDLDLHGEPEVQEDLRKWAEQLRASGFLPNDQPS